jgi:apolipoprotein N-acyltransferase
MDFTRRFKGSRLVGQAFFPQRHGMLTKEVVSKLSGLVTSNTRPPLAAWADSFLFAGSSALLLLVANLFPHYWYFSFFALTPFLYRIIKASPFESLRLGFLFGLSFFGASSVNFFVISPLPFLLRLVSGTALFALFGWAAGWARKHWGFYPSIVAVLWVGLEIGLVKLGFTQGLLGEVEFSNSFLHGLVGLFGLLTVSAIIVLLNSLLALAIVKTLGAAKAKVKTSAEDKRTWNLLFVRNLFTEKVYLVPEGRAPPVIIL